MTYPAVHDKARRQLGAFALRGIHFGLGVAQGDGALRRLARAEFLLILVVLHLRARAACDGKESALVLPGALLLLRILVAAGPLLQPTRLDHALQQNIR